jgi:NADPH2:quinone reductase
MKAAVYYQNGGPEVLKYEDVPDPVCYPKGVVIRVEAVSIEGGDTLNRWHGALLTKPRTLLATRPAARSSRLVRG